MSKFFCAFFVSVFLAVFCHAGVPEWGENKLFALKKDQKAYIHITEKGKKERESFEFSWTLYDGLNLVIHTKWRRYPKQIMLSLRRGLELYSQQVFLPALNPYVDEVRVYLEFVSFKGGKARIKAYMMDRAKRVDVEFWPETKEE